MKASCMLNERTTERDGFANMDDFQLPKEFDSYKLSVRLQFPKFSKGFHVPDFKSFIDEHIGQKSVLALGRLAFPNEWQLKVENNEIREKLIRMERVKINSRTCWISPLNQSEIRGHIHWLPFFVSDVSVANILKDYGEVLFIERQTQIKFDLKAESDMLYFSLFLRNGQTMDDVPHFVTVDGNLGFVSIRGRAPICFHCKNVGHRKSECKTFQAKLEGYCQKRPGRGRRERPRGRRFRSKNIEVKAQAEKGCGAGLSDVKLEEDGSVIMAEPVSNDSGPAAGVHCQTESVQNPILHLRDMEKDIIPTLTNTSEELNDKIEVASRFICGELKTKKRKQKKKTGVSN